MYLTQGTPLRVVFCWSEISGYMAHSWRLLSEDPDIDLHVVAFGDSNKTEFSHELMAGISWTALSGSARSDDELIFETVAGRKPDVVLVSGWSNIAYDKLIFSRRLMKSAFAMTIDTQWLGNTKQLLAPLVLRRYVKRLAGIICPGERSYQFARRMGFAERQIHRGLFSVDFRGLSALHQKRMQRGPWPRSFVYVGRYAPEKGIDVLIEGYSRYRRKVTDPWPLFCCGMGPLKSLLSNRAGVRDYGFVQPVDLPNVLLQSGALILASHTEPWGLAILEGCASGLPVIATNACGAVPELVRDHYNGMTIATGSSRDLAEAMLWAHHEGDRLAELGRNSLALASPYSGDEWLRHWKAMLARIATAG